MGGIISIAPITAQAFDKNRTISQDELSNDYGTINKKYDKNRGKPPPRRPIQRPNVSQIEKGSFAYSLGIDAAKTGDLKSAIRHWKLSSNDGNFHAHWQLARYYLGIFKTPKDDIQAIKYLRLIVEQYNLSSESKIRTQISADAMVELSLFYIHGSDVAHLTPNIKLALRLLKLASSSVGHSQANFLLGEIYFNNDYIKSQKKRAVRYYTLAARKNNYGAQIKLGQIYYLQGRNIKAKLRGLAWLMLASKNKPPEMKQFANDIINQQQGFRLNNKQIKSAEKIANQIARKWNF
ncbi:MAG: sel1 repeat family protein [Hyphomicrobiales bacterium]